PLGDAPPLAVTPAVPGRRASARLYLEDALTLAARRAPVVPYPPPPPYRWQNRVSADGFADWSVRPWLKLFLSDRIDVIAQEDATWWSRGTVHNELREAYASWQPRPRLYLEVGRINVRNGVALGFNPTDVFRPRTLVGQASLDPSVLSRNRLGTLMARAQVIGRAGALSVMYAPKLFEPSAIGSDHAGVDPRFDATNAAHRVLVTAGGNAGDLSLQAMAYFEPGRPKVGMALTRPLGSSVVAYAEWALSHEADLVARALDYGRRTGTLPAGTPDPLGADPSPAWRDDVAAGASWTIATLVTVNLEYHFHQGALGADDWTRWFAAGRAIPAIAPELWYVRGYAADQQEPASQHNAFVRFAWPNAGLFDLEVDGFAFVNLRDGSVLTQTSAIYAISDRWTLTLSASASVGSPQSERGSLPQAASGILDLVLYL
ncbi:MAG TPA: hypothetical protein VHM31_17190, partial [Polyangia bacterium]|nr:hypothetical protein [Polyangia bacterium]